MSRPARRAGALALVVAALAGACATQTEDPTAATTEPPVTATEAPAPDDDPAGPAGEPEVLTVDQDLIWGPCDDEDLPAPQVDGTIECATLAVRVDHAEPDSDVIDLALARRPATGGAAEGVIVINPGGPGGSGVDAVARNAASVPGELRERYDVIGFDPRGSNRSNPLVCVPDAEFRRYLDEVDPLPDGDEDGYQDRVAAFESACADRHGELLARVGTRFVARDVEALRRELDVEQITWFGYSYGTLMGTVYAQEFPSRVRALVLDGPVVTEVDPVDRSRISLDGLQRGFERFADDCDQRGAACSLTQHGGGRAALDAVVARVQAGGLPGDYQLPGYAAESGTPGRVELTPGRLGYSLIVAIYNEGSWPALEAALGSVLSEDWGGPLYQLSDVYLSGFKNEPPYTTEGEQNFWALRCADRRDDLEVATVSEGFEQERDLLGDPYEGRPAFLTGWRLPNVWCLEGIWPEPAERLGRAVVDPEVAPPAIVFGATGDFATPIEYAEILGEAVGGGHVVTVEAATHVNISDNQCQIELVVAFVDDPNTPPARTQC